VGVENILCVGVQPFEHRAGVPDPDPDPDQLTLERQLWLDTDGRGWTFQDRLGGQLRRSWRLEMPAPATLGRAAVQGQDQPLTRLTAGAPPGVEVRQGALAMTADGRVEHGGMLVGVLGTAGRAHRLSDRLSLGYFGQLQLAHRMSAVSEACFAVRREAWDQLQGFDQASLPGELGDVDFCLRLSEAGMDIVWTPYAELYHHVPQTVERDRAESETLARATAYMQTRWGFDRLRQDPYYNPNLSLDAEDYSLAWPPRGSYGSSS